MLSQQLFRATSTCFTQVEWYSDTPEPGEDYEVPSPVEGQHSETLMQYLHLQKKNEETKLKIIPELAALGVYAQSVKPKKGFLLQREYKSTKTSNVD